MSDRDDIRAELEKPQTDREAAEAIVVILDLLPSEADTIESLIEDSDATELLVNDILEEYEYGFDEDGFEDEEDEDDGKA